MKKFILVTAALLGCTSPTASLDPQMCIEHSGDPTMVVDNEPFRLEDGVGIGQFSFTGTLVSLEQSAPFSGEPIKVVYLETLDDGSEAHRYFYDKADGTIDGVQAMLLFKLGILEGEGLSSSAYVSAETEEAILTALETGEELTLNMLAGIQMGMGMSANSVNPCLIE